MGIPEFYVGSKRGRRAAFREVSVRPPSEPTSDLPFRRPEASSDTPQGNSEELSVQD